MTFHMWNRHITSLGCEPFHLVQERSTWQSLRVRYKGKIYHLGNGWTAWRAECMRGQCTGPQLFGLHRHPRHTCRRVVHCHQWSHCNQLTFPHTSLCHWLSQLLSINHRHTLPTFLCLLCHCCTRQSQPFLISLGCVGRRNLLVLCCFGGPSCSVAQDLHRCRFLLVGLQTLQLSNLREYQNNVCKQMYFIH